MFSSSDITWKNCWPTFTVFCMFELRQGVLWQNTLIIILLLLLELVIGNHHIEGVVKPLNTATMMHLMHLMKMLIWTNWFSWCKSTMWIWYYYIMLHWQGATQVGCSSVLQRQAPLSQQQNNLIYIIVTHTELEKKYVYTYTHTYTLLVLVNEWFRF